MTNEEINAKWEELQTAVRKLRANREKVPLEQLTTRYASGYNALVQQICHPEQEQDLPFVEFSSSFHFSWPSVVYCGAKMLIFFVFGKSILHKIAIEIAKSSKLL